MANTRSPAVLYPFDQQPITYYTNYNNKMFALQTNINVPNGLFDIEPDAKIYLALAMV